MDYILHPALVVICCTLILLGKSLDGPALDVKQFAINGSFAITCNLSTFDGVKVQYKEAASSIGIARLRESTVKEEIATYSPSVDQDKPPVAHIPKDRKWSVNTSGSGPNISITLNVQDAVCEDAGQYMCMIKIIEGSEFQYSSPVELKAPVKLKTVIHTIHVTPPFGVLNHTSTNTIGTHIRLACTYKGEEQLTNKWAVSRASDYTVEASDQPVIRMKDAENCPIYLHNSTYSFIAEAKDNKSTYHCMVFNGTSKEGMTSMMFIIERMPNDETLPGKSGSMTLEVDAILVLILYLLVLHIDWQCQVYSH